MPSERTTATTARVVAPPSRVRTGGAPRPVRLTQGCAVWGGAIKPTAQLIYPLAGETASRW
jgi:hypothetical protein